MQGLRIYQRCNSHKMQEMPRKKLTLEETRDREVEDPSERLNQRFHVEHGV